MGDDAFSYEDLPVTVGTIKTVGDVYPSGSDQTGVRLITGSGQTSLLQTESDPTQLNIDPETGLDLPAETGVGFSGPYAEYIQSGVYNNQFIYPPPIPGAPWTMRTLSRTGQPAGTLPTSRSPGTRTGLTTPTSRSSARSARRGRHTSSRCSLLAAAPTAAACSGPR
jgi:hypothetical protein